MGEWLEDIIIARGHPNVRARHRTTLEITRDDYLTPRGDCIVGIMADKATMQLNPEVKGALKTPGSRVQVVLETPGARDRVEAWGDPRLSLSDARRLIVRRSSYVEPATLAIRADKAAAHLDRSLVSELREGARLVVVIRVRAP